MARKKVEVKCPWCGGVYAASGMTAHVRHKHPGKEYDEFRANREAIIEKNKVVEGQPTPATDLETSPPPVEEPVTEGTPEPEKTPAPDPKDQQSGSFLGSVGKALRDW